MRYYIYIVRCKDGSRYTGITTDPRRRMREHILCLPAGAKYTKSHPVEALEALWSAETRSEASMLESAIKRLRPEQKRQLSRTVWSYFSAQSSTHPAISRRQSFPLMKF